LPFSSRTTAANLTDSNGKSPLNSRAHGKTAIETILFKALAQQFPPDTQVKMTHISRSQVTARGEHALKQVISLNLGGVNPSNLPTVEALNAALPDAIRVWRLMVVAADFSARRTCEARTFEYLIPVRLFSTHLILE
jgi:tRNA pseudouridine(38-40) synthase